MSHVQLITMVAPLSNKLKSAVACLREGNEKELNFIAARIDEEEVRISEPCACMFYDSNIL